MSVEEAGESQQEGLEGVETVCIHSEYVPRFRRNRGQSDAADFIDPRRCLASAERNAHGLFAGGPQVILNAADHPASQPPAKSPNWPSMSAPRAEAHVSDWYPLVVRGVVPRARSPSASKGPWFPRSRAHVDKSRGPLGSRPGGSLLLARAASQLAPLVVRGRQ